MAHSPLYPHCPLIALPNSGYSPTCEQKRKHRQNIVPAYVPLSGWIRICKCVKDAQGQLNDFTRAWGHWQQGGGRMKLRSWASWQRPPLQQVYSRCGPWACCGRPGVGRTAFVFISVGTERGSAVWRCSLCRGRPRVQSCCPGKRATQLRALSSPSHTARWRHWQPTYWQGCGHTGDSLTRRAEDVS